MGDETQHLLDKMEARQQEIRRKVSGEETQKLLDGMSEIRARMHALAFSDTAQAINALGNLSKLVAEAGADLRRALKSLRQANR